nr:putative reverse transcriptase domain-containing protein [Tanacetum cinerariifolium]
IEGLSKIAKTMTKLTQKKIKFEWGDKQEAAFQLLKQKLCSVPVLALPEGSEDFIVYGDASNKGLGAVLMQREKVENGVIELYFVNTEYQLADLFTKALGRDRIEFLTNKLGMRSFTPETLKKLMYEEDETMATTIEQQVALDEALVPSAQRLRIG